MTALLDTPVARPPVETPRLLRGLSETGRPAGLAEHLDRYGPLPLEQLRSRAGRRLLVETVDRAGLRGRGGAGYPTARKLAAVAARRGRRVVVANGCEGDPTSSKDRLLLEFAPHLVLDGIVLAAGIAGAREAVLCVHRGSRIAELLPEVLAARADRVRVAMVEIPDRYVSSESSALVNYLTGGDARPTVSPPHASERGVRGRPTVVVNVETLAHLAAIARFGDLWFRSAGTADSPGTTLLTVGGAVVRPGVYEIGLGLPVGDALELAGGGVEPIHAVGLGGLGGCWLPLDDASDLPLDHQSCRDVGASLGVAALVALPAAACGLAETARILRYLAAESAGQCGPCMFGLPAVATDMTALARGDDPEALTRLERRLGVIPGRGGCAHPDGAARLAASALHTFAEDVAGHARGRPCGRRAGPPWTPLPDATAGGWW